MATGLGSATVNVLANTANFENSLRRSFKRIGAATAGIAVGVGLTNFISSAIKNSITLERELARIQTLVETPTDAKLFDADKVREFSNEIGIATTQVTDSLYMALGSGIPADNVFDFTQQAARLAVATASDLPPVIDAMTSAVNSYASTNLTATEASDQLFRALQFGKGTMNDFSKYVGTATGIGAQLGVSFDQIAAAGATATLNGTSARKAFTGIKVAMQELTNTTKGGGKVFKEFVGVGFPEYVAKTNDLRGALELVIKSAGGADKLTNVFGAKEGAAVIQNLAGNWTKYGEVVKGVQETSAGSAQKAFERVDDTVSRQIDRLKVYWANFVGEMGDALGPATRNAVNGMIAALDGIKAGTAAVSEWVKARVADMVAAWEAFSAKLQELNSPAIDRLRDALTGLWDTLQQVIPSLITFIQTVSGVLTPIFEVLAVAAGVIVTTLGPSIVLALDAILKVINALAANQTLIGALTTAIVVFTVAMNLGTIAINLQYAAYVIYAIVVNGVQAALVRLTVAQLALSAAFTANPVGVVIAAIVALAAAFVYAWKHSETFREVVVGVLNALADAAIFGASVMFRAFTFWIRGVLEAVKLAANAWSKLPKILGGGIASDISGAVNQILSGLSAVQNGIDSLHGKNITIGVSVAVSAYQTNLPGGGTMTNARGLENASGTDSVERAAANAISSAKNAVSKAVTKSVTGGFGGGGGGGSAGGGGGGSDKSAASDLKSKMKQIGDDLVRIAKDTAEQSVDTLRSNFESLYADFKDAGQKGLIKGVEKIEKKLVSLAGKLETLRKAEVVGLDAARESLKKLKDESISYMEGVRTQVRALGDVADASKGIGTTFTGIRNQLKSAIAQTQQFTAYVSQLKSLGLNATSLKQIIDAGPEAGMASARALAASGSTGIAQINQLQSQLDAAGNALANKSYEAFFKNGIAIADGLVKGLESQEAALIAAMDKLGDALASSIKKKLKIKSPSRVFGDIGENISKGLAVGILDAGKLPQKAAANVGNSINFGPGAVQVNGVADPNAARKVGLLSGEGIQQVITRRRTNDALSR